MSQDPACVHVALEALETLNSKRNTSNIISNHCRLLASLDDGFREFLLTTMHPMWTGTQFTGPLSTEYHDLLEWKLQMIVGVVSERDVRAAGEEIQANEDTKKILKFKHDHYKKDNYVNGTEQYLTLHDTLITLGTYKKQCLQQYGVKPGDILDTIHGRAVVAGYTTGSFGFSGLWFLFPLDEGRVTNAGGVTSKETLQAILVSKKMFT